MTQTHIPQQAIQVDPTRVLRAIDKRSYAVLATTSPAGRSHSAGVLYASAGSSLYVSTLRSSRKARNVSSNSHVGVTIPIRRVPVGGPPSAVMFQTRAEVLDLDDRRLLDLAAEGRLERVTSHGELTLADGCFIKIDIPGRVLTFGLGMSLISLIRDPLNAGGVADLRSTSE